MIQTETPSRTLHSIPSGTDGVRVTLNVMRRLILRGAVSEIVRAVAEELIAHLPQKDYLSEVGALFAYVQHHIRYLRDVYRVETLHSADQVLRHGQGDCDDKTILLGSLLQSIGVPVRLVAVGQMPGHYRHVYLEAFVGSWIAMDATEPQPMGWSPPGMRARMTLSV